MKVARRRVLQCALWLGGCVIAAGLVAPYLTADQYGKRLQGNLERALGRRVELGKVHFSLFHAGFTVDSVIIHEDPAIGMEPIVYVQQDSGSMQVRPSLWSLLGGRFEIASIRLDNASINLTKSGAASEWGRWNFASFVNRSIMRTMPAVHVRGSRINFKFGDTKSVLYLTETDLDITPPPPGAAGWRIACSAKPARTDRTAQGLGWFTLKGRWFVAPERVDLDLVLERSGLGEITALLRGQPGMVHGTVSSRLHLGGPIDNIGILGRLTIEDVHRWDLLPPQGQGWPLDIRGRLDLVKQQLELQSNSPGNAPLPLWVRFRANDYLSQPHWAATLNWNRFPLARILELARHMGAQLPPKLALNGSMDGAVGYSAEGGLQGELAFHDTALTIPDSPPVRFEQARVVLDRGHVHLTPALVRTAADDQAQIEADYALNDETLDLSIATGAMKVESLRAQVALAAVPWLEQVESGQWSGALHYRREPGRAGWSGQLELAGARLTVPGLADPLELASARAQIDGARVVLDQIEGKAGPVAFKGEYRYEPAAARRHRVRLHAAAADAADLEAELMPTLHRNAGLIARALGRASVPTWLKDRAVDGTVQIDDLRLAGVHLANFRGRLSWDKARVDLENVQAKLDRAAVAGKIAINLRGARPSYRFTGKIKGLNWQSGKVDAEAQVETSGFGAQLLAHLTSEGTFTGSGLDLDTAAPLRSLSGAYQMVWVAAAPQWHLMNLNLRTEDDTYTGHGGTADDGRLVIVLTSGSKEMRMSGTLARLKVEEAARP